MTLFIVNTGMTASVVFFALGYIFRKRLKLHRPFMIMSRFANLLLALALLFPVYVLYLGDREAAGFSATVSPFYIFVHRFVTSTAFALMFVMAWTGLRHDRKRHVRQHLIFIVLYLFTYNTGLLFFTTEAS